MSALLNYHDFRQAAKRRLPRGIFEYVDRGTEDETCISHNRRALDAIRIKPSMLTAGRTRALETTLFGERVSMPLVVAPTACAGLVWHRGEVSLAKAAAKAGIPFCAATEAISAIDEIVEAAGGNVWFQLYVWDDWSRTLALLDRAWQAGVRTLLLTVDGPVAAKREHNIRNGYGMPFRLSPRNVTDTLCHPRWLVGTLGRYLLEGRLPRHENYPEPYRQALIQYRKKPELKVEAALSWDHVSRLRRRWQGNLVLKGIMNLEDARNAIGAGCDGIVVSNHGGRNLDSCAAPAQVLAEIADCTGSHLTVLCDSGVQRGSDAVKLLALGAKGVMIGRGFLYGTAAGGEAGALAIADMFRRELDTTMAMIGAQSIGDIRRNQLTAAN
ncbi:alpha-hydroxy acid oxidase [Burkholderia anthina]|uniref:alpha-hydroxy acid oxidase n=1 Tax=Burkholderia anthina TaxID=179879 RepID=UPI001AA02626|nr:alpha-hydroxy acid oxidase [Burkholderia anthina]QTD94925.1 alpha-hydroxy-acid oxidizing protein [Burkholderia anthina]